jgi:hypothetical protein
MADNISLTSFHTAHNGSSVHPQTAQGQVEVMGNPDEIWIRRKGSPGADCFNLSDLQSATPPVRLVTGFRRFLISQYPSLKEIDSYNIIIKKYGEVEAIPEESPVSVLAGNTKQTAHIVEVRPMDLEAAQLHSGQQKVGK